MSDTLLTSMSAPSDLLWSWRRVDAPGRVFTLRSAEALLGGVRYEPGWRNRFGSLATADCAESRYTIKRVGWTRKHVTVRAPHSRKNLATMERGWRGDGKLQFADGKRFVFTKTALLASEFGFFTEGGAAILRMKPASLSGEAADVEAIGGARSLPEFSLLTLVAYYLYVAYLDDARHASSS